MGQTINADIGPDSPAVALTAELFEMIAGYRSDRTGVYRAPYEDILRRLQEQVPGSGKDLGGVGNVEDWLVLQVALRFR